MRRILIGLLIPCMAQCAVWVVLPGNSIQQAVNSAAPGDTVLISDGFYQETVVLYGKSLTVGSTYLLDDDTTHIVNTTIQALPVHPDTASCFVYAYGEGPGSRLTGLTLVAGTGTYWSFARDVVGGCVYVSTGATLEVDHCVVAGGSAYCGGGLSVTSQQYVSDASLSLRRCVIRDCSVTGWGGGLYAFWSSASVESTLFVGNVSVQGGGGADLIRCTMHVYGCRIQGCIGPVGGLWIGGCYGVLEESVFDSNSVFTPRASVCHLAFSDNLEGVVRRCLFLRNPASTPAVRLYGQYNQHFVGNTIAGNVALLYTGTVSVGGTATGEIAYNLFRDNVNSEGGTLDFFYYSRMRVHHNVFEHNVSLDPGFGSVLTSSGNSRPVVDSNIIVGNSGECFSFPFNQVVTIHAENNWWGDPSGPYHPTLNPGGLGDTLYQDSILFIPWLTAPSDTTMPELAIRERPEVISTWRVIAVYPNPFNSTVRLILAGFSGDDFSVTLRNLLGQEVAVLHRGPLTGGEILFTAPPALASGVYFLHAADRLASETRKVVLLR